MGLRSLEIVLLLQRGDRFYTLEFDVYRREIPTTKVNPRAVRVKAQFKPVVNCGSRMR